MRARKVFKLTTKILTSLRREREQGKDHSMKALRAELEWMSQNWKKPAGRNLLPHHPHNNGGNTNMKTPNGANTKTLNGEVNNGKINNGEITSGGNSEGYRLFANPVWQPLCKILAHS